MGTLYVNGTELKTKKPDGKVETKDFADVLGLDQDTDWKLLNVFRVGDYSFQIDQKPAGINLTLKEGVTYEVRWDTKKEK